MQISELELADFIFEKSMKQENKTITRQDADLLAQAMVSAGKTTERVLDEMRKGW